MVLIRRLAGNAEADQHGDGRHDIRHVIQTVSR
jgi:hypothetical protein